MEKKHLSNCFFQLKSIRSSILVILVLIIAGLSACKNNNSSTDTKDGAEAPTVSSKEEMKSSGFSNLEIVEKTDAYGNIERYSRRLSDYAKEGAYSLISPEGNVLETANYLNDTLHGSRVLYFETGDTQIVERYEYGLFAGPYQTYYEGGSMELEGEYIANSMEGTWKRYYKDGQLMEEVGFQDNQENGPFIEYHPNGNLKAEGYYKDGDNEHGSLKLYDEEGILVKTMNCKHGVCRTIWEKGKEES